jgi:hypothetical protein
MNTRFRTTRSRFGGSGFLLRNFGDFRCLVCQVVISTQPLLSAVQHRDHCPYCLWSRHMDLYAAGDRLSACKAGMRPIGLTAKRTPKKYATSHGELMLVHQCISCGKLSLNRLAADDDGQTVLEVFRRSMELDACTKLHLERCGIGLLQGADVNQVATQLFGIN